MTGSRVVAWKKKKKKREGKRKREIKREGERENRKSSAITEELLSS